MPQPSEHKLETTLKIIDRNISLYYRVLYGILTNSTPFSRAVINLDAATFSQFNQSRE